ncbi:shikimate dehydrogenase [Bacillus sp. Marseille-P3661]|uniref:shikimate dehydrogenase n=1 Tax=Bacillus sp. Marseille-P3661 TaxID=1936234 RepID=UPI000C8424C8|nr:shikimate dehydrogenase [Bacillus sp. Marseille-P3661]
MGKLYGVIGHPIGHSMSPAMHNDQFSQLGFDCYYQAFDVEPAQLEKAIEGMRALGIAGFNVTIPHKVDIMKYLDEVNEEAKKIGAVNTVVNDNGRLIGYNTDGKGLVLSLQRLTGTEIQPKSVLIIGAGGAARAIFVTLANIGVARVDIANRTIQKAKQLISVTNTAESHAISMKEAEASLERYDIIINTTSVGMSPNIDDIPLELTNLKRGTILSDIIYNPIETKWLRMGASLGAITQGGVGMLVGQGALAFELWTGEKPDFMRMEEVVINRLGGSKC